MSQELSWQVGDRYRTESGEVFEISRVHPDSGIDCADSQGMPHAFSLEGRNWCSRFQGYDCAHGDLMSRVTGSVKA